MVGPSVQSKEGGGEEQNPAVVGKPKGPLAAREEEILAFWNKEGIFEKSLAKNAPKGEFVFYDGPPFANGLPHYGHILASAIKDAIPRYRTMQGYHVARQWGWDCHGLPVENLVEKDLGFKSKRDIEEYGIEKFNAAARVSIMKDVSGWKRIVPRIGRWADMERDYKTMDASYTESVWWAFKTLYDRKLAYEGFKAMHLCPRCGTTLSNFEVAQGYLDIEDIAVTVKLPLVDEPDTSLLVWTTTPWTLPGNAAAAVKEDVEYWKVKDGDGFIIASAQYFSKKVLGSASPQPDRFSQNIEPTRTFMGKELVGKKYLPPFDYFATELHKHKTHAWRVYAADFVTVEDGTGIVHVAPAFGADDLALAQKNKIPLIHHVTEEGKFIATVRDFAHLPVKPKGRHQETDAKVTESLRERGLLFAEEKVKHSYPHCWRCDTPLLNWAANSWFVDVQKIKGKLLKQNGTIGWVPGHVGEGRFGKWLEGARDWAISRSRYWGAPIPVWKHQKTGATKVIGSVDELLAMAKRSGNRYFVMRHGEARHNVEVLVHDNDAIPSKLTARGKESAARSAQELVREKIDLIVASPLERTQETARIVARELGLPDTAIMTDERLRETGVGEFTNRPLAEWKAYFGSRAARFDMRPPGGESYTDIRQRMGEFIFDIERRYAGKNILLVTHGDPAWLLRSLVLRVSLAQLKAAEDKVGYPEPGEWCEMPFVPFPHNAQFELDLHRPYIDDFDAGEWERQKDVFDCWFESGSMPYASNGYPFNKERFDPKRMFGLSPKGYPADFIAEGLDQTRGWFYSLIVLGTGLFNRTPYKNVIVNGIVVAQDGQKMSKRLKNYPDPMEIVEKYGADSLRYFLLSSPVVRGEDLRFNERGVDEVGKKLLMRLDNVRSFYDLYTTKKQGRAKSHPTRENSLVEAEGRPEDFFAGLGATGNVLDRWILARLGELVRDTTVGFETYQLDVAARPLSMFIDDLSTWYVRRSRDRFKTDGEDKAAALATLRHVLVTTAKVMAPLMPFFADDLYRRLRGEGDPQSVHLADWPLPQAIDVSLIADMAAVRILSSEGLKLREKAGIKVRQPLARFTAVAVPENGELRAILADELNVKEVVADASAHGSTLDTELTPELKEEGMYREYVRTIQDWRKVEGFNLSDRPGLLINTNIDIEFLKKFREALKEATGLLSLEIKQADEIKLERL